MSKRKVYWDSCVFIGLLSAETGKVEDTQNVWKEAELGQTEIWTSNFSLVEVYKAKCEGQQKPLDPANDAVINSMFAQPWVEKVVVDAATAMKARELLRKHHPTCKKPTDGLHLATAIMWEVDEIHTWDGADLLSLDGVALRRDGKTLKICKPYALPPTPTALVDTRQGLLFDAGKDS